MGYWGPCPTASFPVSPIDRHDYKSTSIDNELIQIKRYQIKSRKEPVRLVNDIKDFFRGLRLFILLM